MGTICFEGTARQLFRHRLEIINSSGKRTSFQCTASHPEITFSPQPFVISSETTGLLDVLMRPTLSGNGEANVVLTSEELGMFKYLVKYDIRSPGIEKRVILSAPLGRDAQQVLRFLHFGKKPTTYQLSLEAPADSVPSQRATNVLDVFSLESKGMQVPADPDTQGVEFCVPVKFVPARLQETKAILCARGAEGQQYKVTLFC